MDLLTIAKKAAERVEAASAANKVPVAVCVVDVHGNVVLQHRMTGAPVFSIELSERKAYTSALVGMRTADLLPLVQPGQPLIALSAVAGGRFWGAEGGRSGRQRRHRRPGRRHRRSGAGIDRRLRRVAAALSQYAVRHPSQTSPSHPSDCVEADPCCHRVVRRCAQSQEGHRR